MHFLNRWIAWLLLGVGCLSSAPAQTNAEPRLDYKEVYDLIKSQLPHLQESTLSDTAARGLIRGLGPQVQLVTEDTPSHPAQPTNAALQSRVFEKSFACLHLDRIEAASPPAFQKTLNNLQSSNTLKGLILDLRFTQGEDYAAAAQLADLFFTNRTALLDWGKGVQNSHPKDQAIDLPLVLLVNRQTAGAAEALAAVLRHGILSLLIGSPTAGHANVYRDFKLTTGHHLRVAAQPVAFGEEGQTIPPEGLQPDLVATAPVEQERIWLEDPYKALSSLHNRQSTDEEDTGEGDPTTKSRRRINEADLVRMMEEGRTPGMLEDYRVETSAPAPPVIQDPVLARGLDFLKGLAVVRPFQSQ